ncbi:MAG: hypothetical protein ABJD07_03290 [Gemmatimonadaceae bacterium]
MFIELVDRLRCPREHAPDWLVAAPLEMRGRDIVRGVLGCPTCRTEYRVERGVAELAGERPRSTPVVPAHAGADGVMRLAALLNLASPGGFVALTGAWSALAPALAIVVEGVHVLAIDPVAGVPGGDGVSLATAPPSVVPLRAATARGIALDDAHAALLHSAVAALAPGGRLIAPVSLPVPPGVTELARDEAVWVAERDSSAPVVQLARGKR